MKSCSLSICFMLFPVLSDCFVVYRHQECLRPCRQLRHYHHRGIPVLLAKGNDNKISPQRRKQLGIADEEDEYDLGVALSSNTDPLITKIIAGSLIVAILSLLVVGVIIPSTTDYGEGVCNPIVTQGRCP